MTKVLPNHIETAAADSSFKEFSKKIGYSASIFAVAFSSQINSAQAADGQAVGIAHSATNVTTSTTNIDQSDLTLQTDEGTTSTFTLAQGVTVDTLTFEDSTGQASAIAVSGDFTVDESIIMIAQSTTATVYTFTVAQGKTLTLSGNSSTAANGTMNVILASGTMAFDGAGTQAIAMSIESDSGNDGVIAISGAGVKTFAKVIGGAGTDEVGTITTTANSTSIFSVTVDAVTVTNLGTMTLEGASNATTITNSGTFTLNNTIDNLAANGDASIVMHTTGSILNFNHIAGLTQDMVITATTDGFGTINIIDASDGGAAAVTTTAGGDIGTNTVRIGTLNVGSTAQNGALTTVAGDAIFVDNFNLVGGNAANEHSVVTSLANITATEGLVMTAAGIGNAEINTTAATTIAGDITSVSTGAGSTILDIDIATTFSGSIGTTSSSVDLMEVANTKAATLTGASINIASTVLTGTGNLVTSGTVAQTVGTALTVAGDDQGAITNSNAVGTTFSNDIATEAARILEVTLADNAKTTFDGVIYAKTLDINTAANADLTTINVGGHVIGDNGTTGGGLEIVAGSAFQLGTAIVDGTTVFNTKEVATGVGGVLIAGDITFQPAANFTSGTINLIDGTNAGISATELADILITSNTPLTTFAVTGNTIDVSITATPKSAVTTAKELSISTNDASAMQMAMQAAQTGGDSAIVTALDNSMRTINSGVLATTSDFAKQAAPQTDTITGSTVATKAMTGSVQGIVSNRMASLRSGDAFIAGMSAGNGMTAQSGFIQAFGSEAEQENRALNGNTVFGFDSETDGIALGFDGITDSGSTIGLSASYSSTSLDGKGKGKSTNDVDSYTVSVYADKATENGYIEGSLTYGLSENSTTRVVNTAGANSKYSGAYDSEQVSLKVGAGVPKEVASDTFVTPFGSLTSTLLTTDVYTETSATDQSLRLKVAQDDVTSLVGTLGVKAHIVTPMGTPMISLAVNNEFGDTSISSTNTYTGGGTAFKTSTDIEELSATLGLGYSFGNDVTSLNLAYEAEANDTDYMSHFGSVKIVAKF